jgi:hypothetical protein
MTLSEEYKSTAMKLREIARNESDSNFRAKWESLALDYLRLAEQFEKNSNTGRRTIQARPNNST